MNKGAEVMVNDGSEIGEVEHSIKIFRKVYITLSHLCFFIPNKRGKREAQGESMILNHLITAILFFLGSASIYSLLNDAIVAGLSYMIILYIVGCTISLLRKMRQ